MAQAQSRDLDRVWRRLRRMEGPVNMKTVNLHDGATALDFELGFPEGRKTPVPDYRRTGPEQTSIVIDDRGQVDALQMRLASVPKGDSTEPEMETWVGSIITRAGTHGEYTVRIADDRMAWTPHVELDMMASPLLSAEKAVDDIQSVWSLYRENVREDDSNLPRP